MGYITLDKVRAEEARRLKQEGQDPVLSKSRWCFLKRKENLTDTQGLKLVDGILHENALQFFRAAWSS